MIFTKFNQTPFNRTAENILVIFANRTSFNFQSITATATTSTIAEGSVAKILFLPSTPYLQNFDLTATAEKVEIDLITSEGLLENVEGTMEGEIASVNFSPSQGTLSNVYSTVTAQKANINFNSNIPIITRETIAEGIKTKIQWTPSQATFTNVLVVDTVEKVPVRFTPLESLVGGVGLVYVDPVVSGLQRKVMFGNPQSEATVPNNREVN